MHAVVRNHEIHCGHRVVGHEGKCKNLHGHSYIFELYCKGANLDDVGRVIDFSVIKKRLCQWLEDNWDHRMLIWDCDPLLEQLIKIDKSIAITTFNPTAENIAEYFLDNVAPELLADGDVICFKVVVHETGKCRAIYEVL